MGLQKISYNTNNFKKTKKNCETPNSLGWFLARTPKY